MTTESDMESVASRPLDACHLNDRYSLAACLEGSNSESGLVMAIRSSAVRSALELCCKGWAA